MVKKIKDDERVSVDYGKIIKLIDKRGLSMSMVSTTIGRSPGFIGAMYNQNGKMLYRDVKGIARVLYIHGGTKLLASGNGDCSSDISKDAVKEIKANMSIEERIADALERIAICLERIDRK